jgi:hypothetical protein
MIKSILLLSFSKKKKFNLVINLIQNLINNNIWKLEKENLCNRINEENLNIYLYEININKKKQSEKILKHTI